MAQTHKSMILQDGIKRGQAVSSWIETPKIGTRVLTESEGSVIVTPKNKTDVWFSLCWDAEAHNRQYSPFELTARDLNRLQQTTDYDVWAIFEEGVHRGFELEFKGR